MARGLDTVQGSEENRSAVWMQQFFDRLGALASTTLTDVPIATTSTPTGRRVRFTAVKRVDWYSRVWDDVDVDA